MGISVSRILIRNGVCIPISPLVNTQLNRPSGGASDSSGKIGSDDSHLKMSKIYTRIP